MDTQCEKEQLPAAEREKRRKRLAEKETDFLRLRRKRLNFRCFESLKVIGKGKLQIFLK